MTGVSHSTVERAAEVMNGRLSSHPGYWSIPQYGLRHLAQALVDAGWHDGPPLTDADRAVLDDRSLAAAVRARREAPR